MASADKQCRAEAMPLPPSPFLGMRPKVDSMSGPKELVSILKRAISEAAFRAQDAEHENDTRRLADLRLAIAFSSQKLRNVIDGVVPEKDAEGELRQALNVLLNTLY